MIRWYAVTCWDVLEALGYEWMMRFDDDSFLLSRVDYDWFAAMRRENREYGFRALSRECDRDFGAFVDAYRASRAVRKSTTGFGAPEVFVSQPIRLILGRGESCRPPLDARRGIGVAMSRLEAHWSHVEGLMSAQALADVKRPLASLLLDDPEGAYPASLLCVPPDPGQPPPEASMALADAFPVSEVGRASCRERV